MLEIKKHPVLDLMRLLIQVLAYMFKKLEGGKVSRRCVVGGEHGACV